MSQDQQPVASEDPKPKQGILGMSKLEYGEQSGGYVEPGEEGQEAVETLEECGAFSPEEHFSDPTKAEPTGE